MCTLYISNFQFLPTHMPAADCYKWTEKRDCVAEETTIGHSKVWRQLNTEKRD